VRKKFVRRKGKNIVLKNSVFAFTAHKKSPLAAHRIGPQRICAPVKAKIRAP
jgi:hypothetical protein